MATVGVLRESGTECRVALTPDGAARLRKLGVRVAVESGAGRRSFFDDRAYAESGAEVGTRDRVYADCDVLVCLAPPPDLAALPRGRVLVGLLAPLTDPDPVRRLAVAGVTALSLDLLPRTLSRAQPMDALTSQANVAGYKAALVAAAAYGGFFPMLMTAAGTTRPAQVLVLGAGVAGLQAIATARRLGALVTGYDVRDAARADIASTGAAVLDLPAAPRPTETDHPATTADHPTEIDRPATTADRPATTTDHPATTATDHRTGTGTDRPSEAATGYARALDAQESTAQVARLGAAVPRFDVVITTAQVPGRRPPVLVSAAAVAAMRPGSVLVDLASGALGGNVAGSVPDTTTLTAGGVTVIGAGHLPSSVPRAASTAYARNVLALLAHLMPGGVVTVDLTDEILAAVVVAHGGRLRLGADEDPQKRELRGEEIRS